MSPPLSVYPPRLRELLRGSNESQESRNFRLNIRQYNNVNAFASMSVKTVPFATEGPYCFEITGEIHHLAAASLVYDPQSANLLPKYGHLFIYDPEAAIAFRMRVPENSESDVGIMEVIEATVREEILKLTNTGN